MDQSTLIVLGFISSLAIVIITQFILAARATKEKLETANNNTILVSIEKLDIKLMGKLESLTAGQNKMEKKIEELEGELKQRKEDAHTKTQTLKDLDRQVRENAEWIRELQGRYKNIEQWQGMKNVSELMLKQNKE